MRLLAYFAVRLAAALAGGEKRLGQCPTCRMTVFASDPHIVWRGQLVHAEPCVERTLRAMTPDPHDG